MKKYFCLFVLLLSSFTVSCDAAAFKVNKDDVNFSTGDNGENGETLVCSKTDPEPLSQNDQSLTFIVQDSTTTKQMIQKMQSEMAKIIYDMTLQYPKWISRLNLLKFTEYVINYQVETKDPNIFLNEFKQFSAENALNTTEAFCKELPILESIYIYLVSSSVEPKNPNIYIFINGIIRYNANLYKAVLELIAKTKSKIYFIQTNPYPCGEAIISQGPSLMWNISSLSGGEVYVTSAENIPSLMKTFPFQYQSSLISEAHLEDCSNEQIFKFPIDSQTQTVNIIINGELSKSPKYINPNGNIDDYSVKNAYNDFSTISRFDQMIALCNTDDGYWVYVNGKCLSFNTILKTWKESQEYCSSRNSALMSILSDDDQQTLYLRLGQTPIWTGLNDLEKKGIFVWDQNNNLSIPISYTNWGKNEPNVENGRCVMDSAYDHWQVKSCDDKRLAVCVRNYYNSTADKFTPYSVVPGIWAVKLQTYQGPCSIKISAQSNIVVYSAFVKDEHDDIGTSSPTSRSNNFIISHVDGLISLNGTKNGSLETVTFRSPDTSITLKMNLRDSKTCKHQFISSESFHCSPGSNQITFTGIDSNGYDFQRIQTIFCSN